MFKHFDAVLASASSARVAGGMVVRAAVGVWKQSVIWHALRHDAVVVDDIGRSSDGVGGDLTREAGRRALKNGLVSDTRDGPPTRHRSPTPQVHPWSAASATPS
ncbi:MAG TPA: hypothetical protein VGF99_12030 [Myxococcota bacterium]